MRNSKLYVGVKIHWCNRFITLDEDIREVDCKDPNDILYEDGMTDFKFVDVLEYEESGTIKRKVINEDDEQFFFGEFISLEDLKAINTDGKWNNAIYNIEGSHGIGMVTSPNGFHSIMPQNGIIINSLTQTKKI